MHWADAYDVNEGWNGEDVVVLSSAVAADSEVTERQQLEPVIMTTSDGTSHKRNLQNFETL